MSVIRPRLRVAIVGAGMIGRAHAHAFRSMREFFQPVPADVELALVVDADAALAQDARERFGFERAARSWEEAAEASDVDLAVVARSEEHTSELQSRENLVCRLLLEKKKK